MQWNFNYRHPVTKNRINMALGSYPEVSLAQARKKTVEARESGAIQIHHSGAEQRVPMTLNNGINYYALPVFALTNGE
ncbi:hypothetical protein J2Y88_003260 [Pseudomonas chlororaphis]|nr:hypothetical protein [Pseudomonas chlororaphis]MCP1592699.1 hypothetical protein [Pseudomonas chlororaphis]